MIAIDTNIVVRLIVNDDPAQTARAKSLMSRNDVLLLTTVVLEVEWVLRSVYRLSRNVIHDAINRFCGLAVVTIDRPAVLRDALAMFHRGTDFADALHLAQASAEGVDGFATFDDKWREFIGKTGGALKAVKI